MIGEDMGMLFTVTPRRQVESVSVSGPNPAWLALDHMLASGVVKGETLGDLDSMITPGTPGPLMWNWLV